MCQMFDLVPLSPVTGVRIPGREITTTVAEWNHSCTAQCPVPCGAASRVFAPTPARSASQGSCGKPPEECVYPNCACVFMPEPGGSL